MIDPLESKTPLDVAIIGGGPAGCSTALALARHGHRCLVVEKSAYADIRVGETLPPAVRRLLVDLGVWGRFVAAGFVQAHVICAVWGADHAHENAAIFDPYGAGWHVDRQRFDRLLAQAAVDAGVSLALGSRVTSSDADASGVWRLSIDRQTPLASTSNDVTRDSSAELTPAATAACASSRSNRCRSTCHPAP